LLVLLVLADARAPAMQLWGLPNASSRSTEATWFTK
jgi:hypothetical protein